MVQPVPPAAQAQQAQAAAQTAIDNDGRIKKSTDLLWYYGIPSKETISTANLIDRLEVAAGVTKWKLDDQKIR